MKLNLPSLLLTLACMAIAACTTTANAPEHYRIAVVALVEDPENRASFEDSLATKLRANDYDAVASYSIAPDVNELDDAGFTWSLAKAGVQGIIMARPASVGPGASLESVKGTVSDADYADMRDFAREISPTHDETDMVAVVHAAFYMLRDGRAELLSPGAVWLDEPVASREEGVDKLQDLIVVNMNRARPAAREYLGLRPIDN